jgi:Cys-tRNA(Pro)/Cys-tRNA(Cys) deacylase
VAFTPQEYSHDSATPSYGLEAAEVLAVEPDRVFKTLVAKVDGQLSVAVVPGFDVPRPQGAGRGLRRQAGDDGRSG